jgi:hypothetical protein
VAAGLPGWAAAGMSTAPGPGSLPRHRGLPGVAFAAVQALRRLTAMISSRSLTWRVKAQGN